MIRFLISNMAAGSQTHQGYPWNLCKKFVVLWRNIVSKYSSIVWVRHINFRKIQEKILWRNWIKNLTLFASCHTCSESLSSKLPSPMWTRQLYRKVHIISTRRSLWTIKEIKHYSSVQLQVLILTVVLHLVK